MGIPNSYRINELVIHAGAASRQRRAVAAKADRIQASIDGKQLGFGFAAVERMQQTPGCDVPGTGRAGGFAAVKSFAVGRKGERRCAAVVIGQRLQRAARSRFANFGGAVRGRGGACL